MSPETSESSGPTKAEIIAKIGKSIEERRKARGLTHEKITQTLRIKPAFLKSIETGNWEDLPGEVYARGFVARYAQFLGLDGKEILASYLEFQKKSENRPTPSQKPSSSSRFPTSGFLWIGVGLVVLIGLVKVIINDQKSVPRVAPPAATVGSKTASSESTPLPVVKKLEPHTIGVYSPFPLWLGVKSETRSFEGFIPQGTTWTWKGEGNFVIRLGHTQQVVIEFDGKLISLAENQKRVSLPSEN